MKTTKSILVIFIALLTAQIASAYYCPSTGRWLSRDPIGEPGFQALRATGALPQSGNFTSLPPSRWIQRDSTNKNSSTLVRQKTFQLEKDKLNGYAFLCNDTANAIDSLGLYTIINDGRFDQGTVENVRRQISKACGTKLLSLADPSGRYYCCTSKKCIIGIVHLRAGNPKNVNQSGFVLGFNSDTFRSLLGRGQNIDLYPENGNPSTPWGDVAIHEFAHSCGWAHNESGLDPAISDPRIDN
ncbi:MAG: hypothetical protein WCJ07_02405 [Verrucomicrobiota bacterium]